MGILDRGYVMAIRMNHTVRIVMQTGRKLVRQVCRLPDLSRKLRLGFGVLIVLSVMLSALVFVQSRRMAQSARVDAASDFLVENLDAMRAASLRSEIAVRDIAYRGDVSAPFDIRNYQRTHARLAAQAQEVILEQNPGMLADFDAYRMALQTFDQEIAAVHLDSISAPAAGRLISAEHARVDALRARGVKRRFEVIRQRAADWARTADSEGMQASFETSVLVGFSAAITLIFGVALARFVEWAITSPIREMTEAMQSLAGGNLDVVVPHAGRSDEVGRMAQAVEVFRLAAIDRDRLKDVAAASSLAIETERSHHDAERAETAQQLTLVVTTLAAALDSLARGDLSMNIDIAFSAEYEAVRQDFNSAVIHLRQMIEQVASNSRSIERGAIALSAGSAELALRTALRTRNLQQAAVALDETTQVIDVTTHQVEQVGNRVNAVRNDAELSERAAVEARASMLRIGSASDQISRITTLIDGIAAQSNLLALNATIEAARAGQEGLSFGIVAHEMRLLARQSSSAAGEIRALISEANEQIQLSADMVLKTGDALRRIGEQIFAIDDIAQSVATASRSQAGLLNALNQTFRGLDDTTREDADLIVRSDIAVQALNEQTQQMGLLVARFRTAA